MSTASHVPGRDGRAGMAAIVVRRQLATWRRCTRILRERLPDYARPLFLRIRQDIDVTATFKQKKIDLVSEGFNPEHQRSDLFQRSAAKAFVRLDPRAVSADLNPADVRL